MKVFNYYKTCNNNKNLNVPVHLYFEDVTTFKEYKGFYIAKSYSSEYLIKDNIIISEKVKQSTDNIDILLNGGIDKGKLYHLQTRPLEALSSAKRLLSENGYTI